MIRQMALYLVHIQWLITVFIPITVAGAVVDLHHIPFSLFKKAPIDKLRDNYILLNQHFQADIKK